MGYVLAEELYSFLDTAKNSGRSLVPNAVASALRFGNAPFIQTVRGEWDTSIHFNNEPITMEDVEKFLDTFHAQLIGGDFTEWKAFRPWTVANITAGLPEDQAWIGWEVETGWEHSSDRSEVVKQLFNNYNHVCIDDEGPGYGVEMTWGPNVSSYWDNKTPATTHPLLFTAAMAAVHETTEHEPEDCVGTHINVSTPTYRKLNSYQSNYVRSALDRGLCDLTSWQREELLGRAHPYEGWHCQSVGDNQWLEGKLFNSTYRASEATSYIEVGNRWAACVEALSVAIKEDGGMDLGGSYISNIYDALSRGAAPNVVVKVGGQARYEQDYGLYDDGDYDVDGDSCGDPECDVCYPNGGAY